MLASTVRETIAQAALVAPGDRVLVALSGGPDSTALLHVLIELRDELECELCVAHLNHTLRGRDSDADERWCAKLAEGLSLPLRSGRIDVAAETERRRGNLEEVARDCRYRFLEEAAGELGADRIAVAHTRDDQVETVLLRLLRGAAAGGLRGMRYARGRVVRPLLDAERGEVLAYLRRRGLPCRTDASNADERFARVFLRRRVMPLLLELNPSLVRTAAANAALLGDEDDLLWELAEEISRGIVAPDPAGRGEGLELDAAAFASLHPALQRRVLRRAAMRVRGHLRALSSRTLEALRRCALGRGPAVELDGEWTAALEGGKLAVRRKPAADPPGYLYLARAGRRLDVKEVDKSFALRIIGAGDGLDIEGLSGPRRALLDADAAGEELEVRPWRNGDRYRPLGAPGRQKLQDLFVNAKIARPSRARHPVFLSRGSICWVSGLRVGEGFRVTQATRRILSIEEVD